MYCMAMESMRVKLLTSAMPMRAKKRAVSQKPGRVKRKTVFNPKAVRMQQRKIFFRGISGWRSAQAPSWGWKRMPAMLQTATKTPTSALVKPRSSTMTL